MVMATTSLLTCESREARGADTSGYMKGCTVN